MQSENLMERLEAEIHAHIIKLGKAREYSFALTLIQDADAGMHLRSMIMGLKGSFADKLLNCPTEEIQFWRGAALTAEQIILALESARGELEEVDEQIEEASEEVKALESMDEDDEDEDDEWSVTLGRAEF